MGGMLPDVSIATAETPATLPDADIVLLPGRAAFLPATRTLLVADLHLGKAATFRRVGIPVPEGSAQRDLSRLERLVTGTGARRLVVLGDLFHAKGGCTPAVLDEFSAARSRISATEVILIVGNHDRSLGRIPASLGIDSCLRTLDEPPFHFVHEPATPLVEPDREAFNVAGHLHPTLAIHSPSGDRVADRCFVAEGNLLVLPAFGSFTGGHRVKPAAGMRLWIARDDGVVDVTRLAALASRSAH
jgi:DNA ligase-associated metallophosphoesterase